MFASFQPAKPRDSAKIRPPAAQRFFGQVRFALSIRTNQQGLSHSRQRFTSVVPHVPDRRQRIQMCKVIEQGLSWSLDEYHC